MNPIGARVDSLEAVGWQPTVPKTTRDSLLNPVEAVGWQLEVFRLATYRTKNNKR